MQKKSFTLVTLLLFFFSSSVALAQFNSAIMPDIPYNSFLPPSTGQFNVGLDYHDDPNYGGGWIAVAVSDKPENNFASTPYGPSSAAYFDIATGGSTLPEPFSCYVFNGGATALDPDVVVMGQSPALAVAIYYESINPTQIIVHIDIEPNITSPSGMIGLSGTPFTISSGFTPVVNIDANQYGDWVISCSTSPTTAYFAMGNGLGALVSPTWYPFTGAVSGEYVQPDVAMSDVSGGSAYGVALDNGSSVLQTYLLTSSGSCTPVYNYSSIFNEPRIACPPSGSNQTTDWAVDVQIDGGGIDLCYGGTSGYFHTSLTNGSSGLSSLVSAPGANSRPCISYNKDRCGTISANWYNSNYGGIIGVEIESGAGFPQPFNRLRDWYGTYTNFMAISNLNTDEPSAVCGRYGDVKSAAFNDFSRMQHHHIDCIGAWRKKNPATSPTSASSKFSIFPNPSNDVVTLKIDADEVSASSIILIENLLGQKVLQTTLNSSLNSQQINIGNLPAGMYNIKVVDNGQLIYTTKMVKE